MSFPKPSKITPPETSTAFTSTSAETPLLMFMRALPKLGEVLRSHDGVLNVSTPNYLDTTQKLVFLFGYLKKDRTGAPRFLVDKVNFDSRNHQACTVECIVYSRYDPTPDQIRVYYQLSVGDLKFQNISTAVWCIE
ncbi:hypothetical protein LTR86_010384 [Recurvomyces mirabilis]|nr:hypothetical protein LTR86_010384 [Recurvomyces mirabilis]